LGQPKIDVLCHWAASPLKVNHDICGFDIATNEVLLVSSRQTGRDLRDDFAALFLLLVGHIA
jgi:hypothetical protein